MAEELELNSTQVEHEYGASEIQVLEHKPYWKTLQTDKNRNQCPALSPVHQIGRAHV